MYQLARYQRCVRRTWPNVGSELRANDTIAPPQMGRICWALGRTLINRCRGESTARYVVSVTGYSVSCRRMMEKGQTLLVWGRVFIASPHRYGAHYQRDHQVRLTLSGVIFDLWLRKSVMQWTVYEKGPVPSLAAVVLFLDDDWPSSKLHPSQRRPWFPSVQWSWSRVKSFEISSAALKSEVWW